METKDAEKMVIARPVASKPSCSSFRSFSELLDSAINTSTSVGIAGTTVPIRPKTVRFTSSVNLSPIEVVPSPNDITASAEQSSSDATLKTLKLDGKSNLVYKPRAKFVSRSTASFLANLGNFNVDHQQTSAQLQTQVQAPEQGEHHSQTQTTSSIFEDSGMQSIEPLKSLPLSLEHDLKAHQPTCRVDRVSYDGYNWRKYGQKQVKGSEYPRSYYKCTHPNCPVKKKVERSLDGQIAEIVYKGEHNHLKPQLSKRVPSGVQGKALLSDGSEKDDGDLLWSDSLTEKNDGVDSNTENPVTATYSGKVLVFRDPVIATTYSSGVGTSDISCRLAGGCEEGSRAADGGHEPDFKRRKNEDQTRRVGLTAQGVQGPHVVVQTNIEADVLGDGFRWRKYGQKVVKGNPYPRSYYRCTSPKCNVRKHVERALDDPRSVITTFEGKHNHDMPIRNPNPDSSNPDSLAPAHNAKQ